MLDCFGFASLRCVIGPENSCHNLNQSNVKLKPNTTWSLAFSRALRRLPVSTLCSHWLIIMVTFFLMGSCHHNWIWFFNTQLWSIWIWTLDWNSLFWEYSVVYLCACTYHIKLLRQYQNYKKINKLFIPTFAVCLEWELGLHLVGGWSSFFVSWFYFLVFSVFNVLICFKIVFGLNT